MTEFASGQPLETNTPVSLNVTAQTGQKLDTNTTFALSDIETLLERTAQSGSRFHNGDQPLWGKAMLRAATGRRCNRHARSGRGSLGR